MARRPPISCVRQPISSRAQVLKSSKVQGTFPASRSRMRRQDSSSGIFGRQDMSEKERSERYRTGMIVRRKVLGDTHVDRASAQVTDLDADFQAFITETAWGSLWSRPHLTLRERSIV